MGGGFFKFAFGNLRTFCSFLLVFILLFTDVFVFLEKGLSRASPVHAASGDFSVFREIAGGDVFTSSGFDVTWDTLVSESSNISLAGNDSDITLVDGGKYLVMYNVYSEEGSAGGSNRRSVASYLTLDGSQLEYGWGNGYIRDAENDLTSYNSGAAIIDATTNQDLRLRVERDDGNPSAGTAIRGGTNGISVIKLDDGLDYLRIHKSTDSADISSNTSFTGVTWDTGDEVDSGSFNFSPTSADITVKGGENQLFLVTANVKLNVNSGSGPRQNYEMRLTVDGVEVPGTRTNSYLRYDNGTVNGTLQYVGVIKKTSASDQILNVEVRREGQAADTTNIIGDKTAVAIVALPSSANVLSLTHDSDQVLTSAQSVMNWNEQIATAPAFFNHSTTSSPNEVEISTSGDYLFFATTYTSRTSGTDRNVPKLDWRIDGSVQPYGGHGSYNRGDEGSEDTYTSGASGGVLLPSLSAGEVVDLVQSDETTGTPNANFLADRVALQALEVNELLPQTSTEVSVSGLQPATSSPAVADFELGETFVITETTSARNITNLLLTESGTVDAQSDLSSVRMYYDLDTSNPYDCSSESFTGDEAQFGATSTFSGPNGTVSLSDSVSISTTQTFCGYVLFDIGAGVYDGETINVNIDNPATDVVVTAGGTVSPFGTVGGSETLIENAEITQTGYHWREDDGDETSASSATGGVENTPGLSFSTSTPQRLRIGVVAAGSGAETNAYRLEFAEKITTCEAATGWTDVSDVAGAWDMYDSTFLTDGDDTTNIPVAAGGVSDGGDVFIGTNGGVKETSSLTGTIVLSNEQLVSVAEFDSVSVSNGATTTITLDNYYTDPVVVASARYPRTGTQRTTRISNKTAGSFDVLVDNYNGTLGVGTSVVDYYVMEAGEWTIENGVSNTKIYAGTTSTAVSDGRALADNPGGATVTYPSSFTNPSVLASVVTVNDYDWTFATVYDGVNVDNPPTGSGFTTFLNDNWDTDGHLAAEQIDFIVFEEGNGSNNGVTFDFITSGSANISSTPVSVNFGTAFSSAPSVILVQALTQLGSDGGFAQVDTNTAPTASAVTLSTDEDGASADRGHAAEEVAVISFATAGEIQSLVENQSQFVELEYSVQATNEVTEGLAYCFRVSNNGTALRQYDQYPEATISADVTVAATGTQTTSVDSGTADVLVGGKFSIVSNDGSRTVTSITITETGTIDAEQYLSNPRLALDFDTSAPYDCSSESYGGGETILNGSAFSDSNGTSTFSGGGTISTTQAICAYVLVDVSSGVTDGETIEFEISAPNSDVVVAGSTVGPGSAIALPGTTAVASPALTQANYHWRNDDGVETNATSASGGSENTPIGPVYQKSKQRLRLAVGNDGGSAAVDTNFRLEYGAKVSTCENVSAWKRIDEGPAFAMASTSLLVEGNDVTNILPANGGVTDPNTTFVSTNSGQKEDDDEVASTTVDSDEFTEVEYAVQVTEASAFGATYCFRVTDSGTPLSNYNNYAELTIQDRQDFYMQRGTVTVSGTSTTLVAGVDYIAPNASTSAFVRITNTNMTGAGSDTLGSTRNPDQVTAYIENPGNITDNIVIARPSTATDNTRVSWEIIEYVGVDGADNSIVVRDAGIAIFGGSDLYATGTAVSNVSDDSDVVVFITGQLNPATGDQDFNVGQAVSSWSSTTSEPVFERGDADGIAAEISYAVVEFVGANWNVQRVEHVYSAAGVVETESMSPVSSLSRTFSHAQKLAGDELLNLDENGHEVWLSSIGAVSFQLESGSTNPSDQKSVVWVIENTQFGDGQMAVYRSNGLINSTTAQPNAYLYSIGATVNTANATIWANNRSTGPGNAFPRVLLGARIYDETQFELWKSDEGQNQTFRVEIVEWPVADTSVRQSYYRFYVDNDTLTPTDPWPVGGVDLGENTVLTDFDEPLGQGERTRIRLALYINNASLVADSMSFKLQYGRMQTTCSAISNWEDVGAPGSGEVWRGYDASPADDTTLADPTLLISVSDVAGSYEESNPSVANPNDVNIAEYVEYDWLVENNGAIQRSYYCFRVVESDGSLLDGYGVYPQLRTSGYTPVIDRWRWYDDENNDTPNTPLAGELVTPTDIAVDDVVKLRVSVTEIEGAPGNNIKFNLQFSEYPDFRDGGTTLVSTSSCVADSLWCYADGASVNDAVISTTTLSGVDSCVIGVGDGCGTHNEASGLASTYDQPAFTTAEHEFTLTHAGARVNAVYYFRLVDATNGVNLIASSSLPSLVTEGAALTFSVEGVDAETVVEGVTTDATSTASSINFGSLPLGSEVELAQKLSVDTNGTEGYRVFARFGQDLLNTYGDTITSLSSTNLAPASWDSQCLSNSASCFGYHVGDDVLFGGSLRFALDDTYAGVEEGLVEVMGSNTPTVNDEDHVVYRVKVNSLQPTGDYEADIQYIAAPVF